MFFFCLSLNVEFVRNDLHASSTTGWRLIVFPCGMPACVTPRETSRSPLKSLVCMRIFAFVSSVLHHISSYEHFQPKRYIHRQRKAVRNLWWRFELDPRTVALVACSQSFFRREWKRRFTGFLFMSPILHVRTGEVVPVFVALSYEHTSPDLSYVGNAT